MSNENTVIDVSKLGDVLTQYGNTAGSLITILQKTQEIYGYLPGEALTEISNQTGIKRSKIMGVATFYTQFRLKPVGKYLIMICQGTACHVNSSEKIAAAISDELEIEDGETSIDGLFTLKNVACLGCCSLAPAMMINDRVYGSLTPDKVREIIREIQTEEESA